MCSAALMVGSDGISVCRLTLAVGGVNAESEDQSQEEKNSVYSAQICHLCLMEGRGPAC